MSGRTQRMTALAVLFVVIGLGNFIGFAVIWSRTGGSAIGGGCIGDTCYLVDQDSGTRTVVTPAVWEARRRHELSLWLTHPLAMVGLAVLVRDGMQRRTLRATPAAMDRQVRAIQDSGERLAARRCAGNVGGISVSTWALQVTMYPAGLVFALPLWLRFAVPHTAISAVRRGQGWRRGSIELLHTSPLIASPIRLWCADDRAFMGALERACGVGAPLTPTGSLASSEE